ncbi:MAG: prolyl oligopeptidase family serine peptidase [Spirochaetales bacterium]|nr:prolyl oligopeptidase family serine peptidase [Spirochaetales bacterium]
MQREIPYNRERFTKGRICVTVEFVGGAMSISIDSSTTAPWKKRYRAQVIAQAIIAPGNPRRGLAATDPDGLLQLHAWDTETGALQSRTDLPTGIRRGYLSPSGEWIYYHHDNRGDEIGYLYRVPWAGGPAENVTPEMPEYAMLTCTESRNGKLLSLTHADKEGFHIQVRELGGQPRFTVDKKSMSAGMDFSADGRLGILATTERSGSVDFSLEAYDIETGNRVAELWDGAGTNMRSIMFSPVTGDERLLTTTNTGGFARPFFWNPRTGDRTPIDLGKISGEVVPWDWSQNGLKLLMTVVDHALFRLFVYDLARSELTEVAHDGGTIASAQFIGDDTLLLTSDSAHPWRVVRREVIGDGLVGGEEQTMLRGHEVPESTRWRSASFTGARGEAVHAWIATPPGSGPFPTVVHTHGGPSSVTTDLYLPNAQAWIDHGFAFCSINYHGSVTFGADFKNCINGNLGELETRDVAAGVQWLIEQGLADADLVFKTGASYGGYLTLMSLSRYPALFAGGMAQVAVADWTIMYEDEADTLRGFQRALFGGSPEEKPDEHRKASPLTYVDQLAAPLLLFQGKNDTRCPSRQMEVYVQAARAAGKSIDIQWFDAGHLALDVGKRISDQETSMLFAARVVNGRRETNG